MKRLTFYRKTVLLNLHETVEDDHSGLSLGFGFKKPRPVP